MKSDSSEIQKAVIECIMEHFHIVPTSIHFIPVGEESFSYVVSDQSGERYFVKFCAVEKVVSRIELVNRVLLKLRDFSFVVPPLVANQKTSFSCLNGRVYVFPYIEGAVIEGPNDNWDAPLVETLIDIVAKIHRSTERIDIELPVEKFDDDFNGDIEYISKSVSEIAGDPLSLKTLWHQNIDIILRIVHEHDDLATKCMKIDVPFVLTHGDVTGLNVMQTTSGYKLLDWDGVMLAPGERDLNFFASNPLFSVERYLDLVGRDTYYPEIRNYYAQRWQLESIYGNFRTILAGGLEDKDIAEYKEEIEEYIGYSK